MSDNLLRNLPSVDYLLGNQTALKLIEIYGRSLTADAVRETLDETRQRARAGSLDEIPEDEHLVAQAREILLNWVTPTLRRVINATGVIVHTNLGRAPLSDDAIAALDLVGSGYNTLEFDLARGLRGKRSLHAEELIQRITGAEAAYVVNNNAAAVLLALTALAGPTADHPGGRGVIISRGQLVEIGGGFRMPDVMVQSGAQMVEVGTTNRTHLRDYQRAVADNIAVILRVHHSNFAIVGFTTEPAIDELTNLAHAHGLLAVDDLGSGALLDTSVYGLAPEPTVQASLEAGVDVVMFSGDKLLGGPQAGIMVGRRPAIAQIQQHPLARAVRPDKLCLAALTATLLHYIKGEALEKIPVWRMISMPIETLAELAQHWADELTQAGKACDVVDSDSVVGGGSLPGETLPTKVLAIPVKSTDQAADWLRRHDPPVIMRREEDHLMVDPRTVLARDEDNLLTALKELEN